MPEKLHPNLPTQNGIYRTEKRRIHWFSKRFPSVSFYSRMAGIVVRSAWKAKRGRYDSQAWVDSSLEVLRALEAVGVKFELRGIDHLKAVDGACLIVGNHMSTLETMVLPGIIQPFRETTFVVKEMLITYPVFKYVMLTRDPIAVTQTDPRSDLKLMMSGGKQRLDNGISIVVFPQGERLVEWDEKRFNSVGTKLASRAGVPIIPMALKTDAWGIGSVISDFGRIDPSKTVHIEFGSPLTIEGRGTEEQQAMIDFIEQRLQKWQAAS